MPRGEHLGRGRPQRGEDDAAGEHALEASLRQLRALQAEVSSLPG